MSADGPPRDEPSPEHPPPGLGDVYRLWDVVAVGALALIIGSSGGLLGVALALPFAGALWALGRWAIRRSLWTISTVRRRGASGNAAPHGLAPSTPPQAPAGPRPSTSRMVPTVGSFGILVSAIALGALIATATWGALGLPRVEREPQVASPTAPASPSATPKATETAAASELREFVVSFKATRALYAESKEFASETFLEPLRRDPRPSGANRTEAEVVRVENSYWSYYLWLSAGLEDEFEDLPRHPISRDFADRALENHRKQEEANRLWAHGWSFRSLDRASANTAHAAASTLEDEVAAAWTELEDDIDDRLRSLGLRWADFGGRPSD